jgi:hypothetical protein
VHLSDVKHLKNVIEDAGSGIIVKRKCGPDNTKSPSGLFVAFRRRAAPVMCRRSTRLRNHPGTDAAGADILPHHPAFFHNAQPLDIGLPSFQGLFIGMAHAVTEQDRFAAYFALGHEILRLKK